MAARKNGKPKNSQAIRDRIVDFRRVKASELRVNDKNWRIHPSCQKSALRAMLREVGLVDVVIAREKSGELELIDGHLRQELVGGEMIPVVVVDLNDEEADMVLATMDSVTGEARRDAEALRSLIEQVQQNDPAQEVKEFLDGLLTEPPKLKPMDPKPPPPMTWVLIGIPTVRFGEIAGVCESLESVEGLVFETTCNEQSG